MKKSERMEDIHNRFTLTLAERNLTEPGSENYQTLSELAKMILNEYTTIGFKHKSLIVRHGFRLYGTKYHIITLTDEQEY